MRGIILEIDLSLTSDPYTVGSRESISYRVFPCTAVFPVGREDVRLLHKNGRVERNKKLSLGELRNILCPDEETLHLRLTQRFHDQQNIGQMIGRRKARTWRYMRLRNEHNIVYPTVERFSLDADRSS